MTNISKNQKSMVSEYLKRPYRRSLFPQDDGTFFAEIAEFPGCFATGNTPQEAYAELNEVAESWMEVALAHGQGIPEPNDPGEYSGKTIVRMPKSLHRSAAQLADREGVSLNQFIVTCIAKSVGSQASTHTSMAPVPVEVLIGTKLGRQMRSARTAESGHVIDPHVHIFSSHSGVGALTRSQEIPTSFIPRESHA